jgi:hypothetical protein
MTPATSFVHVERSGTFRLAASCEQVFPLFTPLGEKQWAHGWAPQFCYPAAGQPEVGGVFLTEHVGQATTTWVITQYDPAAGYVAYARITPDLAAGTVTVWCEATSPQMTLVHVIYRMTALSEAGNDYVATFSPDHDPNWLASWESAITHYLHHGQMAPHPQHA